MQVVSGPVEKEKVHYEAPPSKRLKKEMKQFLSWWANIPNNLDGLFRAALAHFWFVSIHPFDDGNGRISRAITDMALAHDEGTGRRLYSMSTQIAADREAYYDILEKTQHGDGDLTDWILWFLVCLESAIQHSEKEINLAVTQASFWAQHSDTTLNARQKKVAKRLLEAGPGGFEGGLTNRKYVGMTKTSPRSAKRDIADLVEKDLLVKNKGRGRSVSYDLVWPKNQ
jgi:Fic family protein